MITQTLYVMSLLGLSSIVAACAAPGGRDRGAAIPAPPDVAAPPPDAVKTASGLATKVLTPGTGTRHPRANSRVTVHYTGWTTDGEMFDSSVTRGESITFGLHQVIAGWTEGVQMMVEGEKRRLWIPERLAYAGSPGAPAGMLVFDVELIKIAD
jgi:peptidylprolyl isomerase